MNRREFVAAGASLSILSIAGCTMDNKNIPTVELETVTLEVKQNWVEYIIVYPEDDVVVYRHPASSAMGESAVHSPELAEKYLEKYRAKTDSTGGSP